MTYFWPVDAVIGRSCTKRMNFNLTSKKLILTVA